MLLGDELDKKVQIVLRERGAVVNTTILLVCAEGIITNKDVSLLFSNSRHILLTSNWGKSILRCMGYYTHRKSLVK